MWYASPDRVSHCAEVRQENIFFARPYPHATWSKQEKRGATCVVHSTGRGEKKRKTGTNPCLYIVPYLHSNVSFVFTMPTGISLSTESWSTCEWSRRVSVDDCVLYWTRCQCFLGAQWVQRVFSAVLTLPRRNDEELGFDQLPRVLACYKSVAFFFSPIPGVLPTICDVPLPPLPTPLEDLLPPPPHCIHLYVGTYEYIYTYIIIQANKAFHNLLLSTCVWSSWAQFTLDSIVETRDPCFMYGSLCTIKIIVINC